MSGIDPGLLPHANRRIYGHDRRRRRHTSAQPRSPQEYSFGGYETDIEDNNKQRLPSSPPRPDPKSVAFGKYAVLRPSDNHHVPQRSRKRKRRSRNANLVNNESDSGATSVPRAPRRRRYAGRKKRRQGKGEGTRVTQGGGDGAVSEDAAVGYTADGEKGAYSSEIGQGTQGKSSRGRGRGRRPWRGGRGGRSRRGGHSGSGGVGHESDNRGAEEGSDGIGKERVDDVMAGGRDGDVEMSGYPLPTRSRRHY